MATVVKLQHLEFGFEMPDEWRAYLDRQTGEVHEIDPDTLRAAERDEDDDEDDEDNFSFSDGVPVPEMIPIAREILNDTESKRFIALPTKWDFHEYRHMEDFIAGLASDSAQDKLLQAIRGRGAFRRFKDTADQLDLLDDWYAYRQQALRSLLADWADQHDLTLDTTPVTPDSAEILDLAAHLDWIFADTTALKSGFALDDHYQFQVEFGPAPHLKVELGHVSNVQWDAVLNQIAFLIASRTLQAGRCGPCEDLRQTLRDGVIIAEKQVRYKKPLAINTTVTVRARLELRKKAPNGGRACLIVFETDPLAIKAEISGFIINPQ